MSHSGIHLSPWVDISPRNFKPLLGPFLDRQPIRNPNRYTGTAALNEKAPILGLQQNKYALSNLTVRVCCAKRGVLLNEIVVDGDINIRPSKRVFSSLVLTSAYLRLPRGFRRWARLLWQSSPPTVSTIRM